MLPVAVDHDNTTGMIKITMGENDTVDIVPVNSESSEVFYNTPRPCDLKDLFFFIRQFVAEPGVNKDVILCCFNQKRGIEHFDVIIAVCRIFFIP